LWESEGYRGSDAGLKLKDSEQWNGDNAFGFTALPAGGSEPGGGFSQLFEGCAWWTSSRDTGLFPWSRFLQTDYESVARYNLFMYENYGCSVRCIKNE